MASLLSDYAKTLPSFVMMHLSLLLFEMGEKLKISHCGESNFLPTITVPSLLPSKLPLSPRRGCKKLISEFVDVEDDNIGGVLEGLLLLWIITSQLVCLVPWLLLSPFIGFHGNGFVLSVVSHWESSKSFPQNLLSPKKIIKSMLVLGMNKYDQCISCYQQVL